MYIFCMILQVFDLRKPIIIIKSLKGLLLFHFMVCLKRLKLIYYDDARILLKII